MKPIALKRSSTGTPYTFTTDPGARGPRLALRPDTSTLTRPPSTLSTSTRPTKVSTSPTSSIHRWSSEGHSIGGVATLDRCGVATSVGGAVEAGTTAGVTTGGRASVVTDVPVSCAGAVPGAGAAAGAGAGVAGPIVAGRDPSNWASAASALRPQPIATAVIS